MAESSRSQEQKKTSKTKAFKKGISKLVKSPKKSRPAVLTYNDVPNDGNNRSATLGYDYRTGQNRNYKQEGILKRSRSLNQIDNTNEDDTESLNSAATISVFRSVHFDSSKHLEEGKISDSGWASSSNASASNGAAAQRMIVHDSGYIQPHIADDPASVNGSSNSDHGQVSGRSSWNRVSASADHINVKSHRSLPRNTKLQSFSDGGDETTETIDAGNSSQSGDQLQFLRLQSTPTSKNLDNLGVIKLVASTQNLASPPVSKSPPVTTVAIQSPQQEFPRIQSITPQQLRELEERIERKVRRTVDKILRKQMETGAPSLSGTNQKLTVWECMVLEIQRTMETLYVEKVQKERHIIRKEIMKKIEAEKRPTQENGTQANLTVVEARPFVQLKEVQHTDFESQTDVVTEPEVKLSILKTQTDAVQQYNAASQTRELEEIDIIESLNARLRNLKVDYDKLQRQYDNKLEEMEGIRIELSTHKRPTSNLVTLTEDTPTYATGTQTNDLTETQVIRDLQMKLTGLERERQKIESLYEEKVTEIHTLSLEYQHNVMNLESQVKPEPKMANVKVQVSPDVYDSGTQSSIRTSDLWTYTDAGKQYPDSSDLQIQVNTVTRDEGSSTVPTAHFDVGIQYSPATRDASDSTMLSMAELDEIEEYASLYRLEREETEIVTKRVRSETPELPDNSLILKYLETSGNRSDDMITAVGVLLKSDEAHTVSLESMRYMDVETTTDQTSEDSTTGYYSKVSGSNGFGENNPLISSLKFNGSRQTDTNYGINGNGYGFESEVTGDGRGYHHSTSGTYFTETERTTKLTTSTPQSDHDYSFEMSTSSMGRPSFESNGSISSERPMRRFLKYGLTGQQQQPVIDHRTNNYVPEP